MAEKTSKPAPIRAVYDPLHAELVWLHVRRDLYRELYAGGQRRVELLNHSASHAFGHIQHMMFDYLLLNIARLTDRTKTGKNKNLTFDHLEEVVGKHGIPKLAAFVSAKLAELRPVVVPLRVHRHKRIAHADYDVALDATLLSGHGVSYEQVEKALDLMAEILTEVHLVYDGSHMTYKTIIKRGGGGSAIVHALKLADRYSELEHEQVIDWKLRSGGRWQDA